MKPGRSGPAVLLSYGRNFAAKNVDNSAQVGGVRRASRSWAVTVVAGQDKLQGYVVRCCSAHRHVDASRLDGDPRLHS